MSLEKALGNILVNVWGKFIWAQFFAYLGLGKYIYGNRPQGPHIFKGFDNMRKAASLNRVLQHMMVIILPLD